MYDSDSKGISWSAGFFMLIAFAFACLMLATLVSWPIWTNMTGTGLGDMKSAMTNPANRDAFRMLQCVSAVIGFLLPACVTAYVLNRKPFRLMGFTGKINGMQIGLVIAITIAALFVSGALSYVTEQIPLSKALQADFDKMEKDYNEQVKAIIGLDSVADLFISLFVMAFLPALCEEALFRGGLQNYLTRWTSKPWLSVIVVSLIFSFSHFSYYGFLPRFFLGAVLGFIYYYSGRLWLSILAHFVNNALAIIMLYVYMKQGKPIEEAMGDTSGAAYWGLLVIPVVVFLFIRFRKLFPALPQEPDDPRREELKNTPFY